MVFDVKANDGSKFEMEHLHKMTMTEESPFYWLNHWYTGRYGKNVGILIEREKRPKEQFPGEVINITFGSPLFGDDTARRFLEEKNFSAKMFHFVVELDPVSQPPLLCSKHLCSEKTRLSQTENIHHTIPRYQLKIHIILYFQDQYVNFLSTVDPFLGPVLDLASYVSPGIIKMVYGCKILHLIRKGKYSKYVHKWTQASMGWDG